MTEDSKRKPLYWTPARLDVLVEMAEDGASPSVIAQTLGCSTEKVVLKLTMLEIIIRSPEIELPPKGWKPNLEDQRYYPDD